MPIRAAKQRALIALLLIEANRPVSPDELIVSLWGATPPPGARNALQNHVLRLRKSLIKAAGDCPVSTQAGGYLVHADPESVDAHHFTALLDRARTTEEVRARSALLHQALDLWRGHPLSDVPSDTLHRDTVPLLVEHRLRAVELRLDADLALGRHGDVLADLRELTAAHPLRERFWAQRMLALYRAGRCAEALECYRVAGQLLADQLGIDPGTELRNLHQAMLTADPALDHVRWPAAGSPHEAAAMAGQSTVVWADGEDPASVQASDAVRLLVHLAAARHRSMHAVLDASYQLCSAQERLLWAWLSVFPGEFDLPAAESVCTGEGITGTEVMDLLAGLVDKSVVTVTRQDRSRRRLLDIIREYGQLRLAELGQRDALAARHAAYYRD